MATTQNPRRRYVERSPAAPNVLPRRGDEGGHPPAAALAKQHQAVEQDELRLIDSRNQWSSECVSKVLTEATDFFVVGVLGTQATGKSTLMNLMCDLAGPHLRAPATSSSGSTMDAAGHDTASSSGGVASANNTPLPVHRPYGSRASKHQTHGVDLRVHPGDRTIVLDSPPLFSLSVLQGLAGRELMGLAPAADTSSGLLSSAISSARQHGCVALPTEGLQELMALQLAAFMMAACHMVVVMVDKVEDLRVWEFLQAAEIAALSLPGLASLGAQPQAQAQHPAQQAQASVSAALGSGAGVAGGFEAMRGSAGQGRLAEVVVVLCNQEADEMQYSVLRPKYDLLCAVLSASTLGAKAGHISILDTLAQQQGVPQPIPRAPPTQQQAAPPPSSAQCPSRSQAEQDGGAGCSGNGKGSSSGHQHVHFFALQRLEPSADGPHGGLSAMMALRNQLLQHPRRSLGRVMSEREWLRRCEALWPHVLSSPDLHSYYLGLQSTWFLGAGGWPLASR